MNSFMCDIVVLVRFVVGDRHAPEDLDLLDVRIEHLPLHVPPQVRHRHAFLLQGRLQLFVGFDLVLRLEVVEYSLELLVAQLVTELLAALDQEHLVHGAHEQTRRDLVQRLAQLGVAFFRGEVDVLPLLTQGLDLPRFEVSLGEDLAVHLHQNLLDDLGAGGGGGQHEGREGQGEENCSR